MTVHELEFEALAAGADMRWADLQYLQEKLGYTLAIVPEVGEALHTARVNRQAQVLACRAAGKSEELP